MSISSIAPIAPPTITAADSAYSARNIATATAFAAAPQMRDVRSKDIRAEDDAISAALRAARLEAEEINGVVSPGAFRPLFERRRRERTPNRGVLARYRENRKENLEADQPKKFVDEYA